MRKLFSLIILVGMVVVCVQAERGRRWRNNFDKINYPIRHSYTVNEDGGGAPSPKFKRQNDDDDLEDLEKSILIRFDEQVNSTTTTDSSPSSSTEEEAGSTTTNPPPAPSAPPTSPVAPSISTTTNNPPSTTVTPIVTTEVPMFVPTSNPNQFFCLCDLTVNCDMNCCCDQDCSAEEKKPFTSCESSLIYDPVRNKNRPKSCVKSYIMYRENIPWQVDRTDSSLFCVVRENVQKAEEFSAVDFERIRSRISHGKIDTKPKYSWDDSSTGQTFLSKLTPEPYKYGTPVWTLRLQEEDVLEDMLKLPASYHTNACTLNQPVLYLLDSDSHCMVPLKHCENVRELDANVYLKNMTVILNPAKTADNLTDYLSESIMPTHLCLGSTDNCTLLHEEYSVDEAWELYDGGDVMLPAPALHHGVCKYTLSQLNLTVVHSGIDGIRHVLAKVLLQDVTTSPNSVVQQFFSVRYIWEGGRRNSSSNSSFFNDLVNSKPLPRSGNPGYLVGKPLILGSKLTEMQKVNETESKLVQRMRVSHVNPTLTIQQSGDCPEDISNSLRRHNVLFGYEHMSSCILPLNQFTHCNELQHHVLSVMVGMDWTTFTNSMPHVASYGNPDAFPSAWVPLYFTELQGKLSGSPFTQLVTQGCESIVTSIHITAAFAYTGPVDSPQAKVVGVFYEAEEPTRIQPDLLEETLQHFVIPVTSTVSFVDVTGRPSSRIATWPVVSIELPSDFFYPFSSSSSSAPSSANKVAWTGGGVMIIINMLLRCCL